MVRFTDAQDWEQHLQASGFGGTAALLIQDETGQDLLSLNAERPFPAASLIKVPLLVLGLRAVERGEVSLSERLGLPAEERVPGAGVLHELMPGLALK